MCIVEGHVARRLGSTEREALGAGRGSFKGTCTVAKFPPIRSCTQISHLQHMAFWVIDDSSGSGMLVVGLGSSGASLVSQLSSRIS